MPTQVPQTEVTILTDAQIKALPTTGVVVVPAKGAGTIVKPISAMVILDNTAGAYTADTFASWQLLWNATGMPEASAPLLTGSMLGSNAFPHVGEFVVPNLDLVSGGDFDGEIVGVMSSKAFTSFVDQNVVIQDFWDGVDDYTGGNAANTLKVIVTYIVIDV